MANAAMAFDVFGVQGQGRFVRKSRGMKSLVGHGIWRMRTFFTTEPQRHREKSLFVFILSL